LLLAISKQADEGAIDVAQAKEAEVVGADVRSPQ